MKHRLIVAALAPAFLWLAGCAEPDSRHSLAGHARTQGGIVDHTRVAGSGIGVDGGPPTGPGICADCDGIDNTRDE